MDLRRVGIVYRKEILESLRDRRTIISTIVIPLVIFPVIFFAFAGLTQKAARSARAERSKIAIVGGEHAPELARRIQESKAFEVVSADDFQERITEKQLRAVLEIPEDFGKRIGTNAPRFTVHYHAGEYRSQAALGNLQRELAQYREEVVARTLDERGVGKEALVPFEVRGLNVAPPKKVTANTFGGLIPYLMIFLTLVGCMAPALDVTVGEKERGTMETILASPIGRTELVMGKFLVVVTISALTTSMALFSNAVTAFGAILFMKGAPRGAQLPLDVSAIGVVGLFILVVPLAVMFAAGQIAIATRAGNYREAQSYLSPLMIVALLPAMAALLPGFEINGKLAWVPILNVCLIAREVLSGTFHWGLIGVVFISSCVYAGLALVAAVRVFKSETVLFRT